MRISAMLLLVLVAIALSAAPVVAKTVPMIQNGELVMAETTGIVVPEGMSAEQAYSLITGKASSVIVSIKKHARDITFNKMIQLGPVFEDTSWSYADGKFYPLKTNVHSEVYNDWPLNIVIFLLCLVVAIPIYKHDNKVYKVMSVHVATIIGMAVGMLAGNEWGITTGMIVGATTGTIMGWAVCKISFNTFEFNDKAIITAQSGLISMHAGITAGGIAGLNGQVSHYYFALILTGMLISLLITELRSKAKDREKQAIA